jgi:hypothetical protein
MTKLESPFEGEHAAPADEQRPIEEASAVHPRDAAIAVPLADLHELLTAVDAHLFTAAGSEETAVALKAVRDRFPL